jgi:hypothetical protein
MRTTRRQAWKKLVWRWGVFFIGLLTLFLSTITFWWDELFPDLHRPHLAAIILAVHWWYWAIAGLVTIIVIVVEAALKLINERENELAVEEQKNQKPEYTGNIYEVLIGSASIYYQSGEMAVSNETDSVVVLVLGVFNKRNVGHPNVGTTVKDYQMSIEVDGTVYEGRRAGGSPNTTIMVTVPPATTKYATALGRDSLGSIYYLHETKDCMPFYVKGLAVPKESTRCNISLTLIDLYGDRHPIEARWCELIKGRVTCEDFH